MSKLLFLAAIAGLAISSVAQSPPPAPSPTEASQEKQEVGRDKGSPTQTENRPRPSPKSAFNQKNPEPPTQTSKTTRSEYRPKSSFGYNALAVTFFTGVLAFLAWLQLKAMRQQAGYMRDGLAETGKAAQAAQKSADTATSAGERILIMERAIVLIDNVKASTRGPAFGLEPHSVVIFTLKNFGRTTAHDVKLKGALTGVGNDPLEEMPPTTIAPQGTNSWVSRSIVYWINEETIKKINARGVLLKYEIDVTYKDSFHKDHWYRCEGRYEPALKQFLITSSTSD
jgi:hypothetical protein